MITEPPRPSQDDAHPALRVQHALTVDVEEWFHGIELPPTIWPSTSRLRVGLDRIVGLLDAHDVRATFFLLGAVAERHSRVVRDLHQAGHEIACHGHSHEFVYRQSRRQFRDDVRRARGVVADCIGSPPAGYRAPYFSIRRDTLWALDILQEEGFAYDSSVFVVRNYRYGFPGSPTVPYRNAAGGLWELPLVPSRMLGQDVPFSGGAYLRILPSSLQRKAWYDATRSLQRVVAYIHPWEFDPDHPRIPLPRRIAATHYARLGSAPRKVQDLLKRFRFGRIDDVYADELAGWHPAAGTEHHRQLPSAREDGTAGTPGSARGT